ncbi:MAG: cytochrome P450 [Lentisphaeria bacterium]
MTPASLDELDAQLLTPQFTQNPYPTYVELRQTAPVHWSEAWQCWLLTRYDDVSATLRDFGSFSSIGTTTRFLDQLGPEALDRVRPLCEHFRSGQVRLDPPDHTRIRAITSKAFTPGVIKAMRPRIEQIVDGLIDAVISTGHIDLIADFGNPLPAIVIADMFGFPQTDRVQFKLWSDEIAAFHGTGLADFATVEKSQEALLEARAWLGCLIEQRRREPTDDLLSRLANAEAEGTRLTEVELFSTCLTFMIGGHETTTNLIGNGMLALLQRPEQLQRLASDPQLISSAVEEMLRYDAPTQRAHRIATSDIELRGMTIRKGDFVQQVLGATNRDGERFEAPDEFNIERKDNKHLSFGVGPHYCPGAPLSRLEAQIAIPTLLRRLPNLRLAENTHIEFGPNNFFRGLTALPLQFDVT